MTSSARAVKARMVKARKQSLREHRHLAALLVAVVLCMKMLVPTGYMIGPATQFVSIQICADGSGSEFLQQMAIPLHNDAGGDTGGKSDHGGQAATCAWSVLANAFHGGAGLELLALALVFILALGFFRQASPPRSTFPRIRPPLRGPPLTA